MQISSRENKVPQYAFIHTFIELVLNYSAFFEIRVIGKDIRLTILPFSRTSRDAGKEAFWGRVRQPASICRVFENHAVRARDFHAKFALNYVPRRPKEPENTEQKLGRNTEKSVFEMAIVHKG